uniref:ATP-dependent RNA helicase n=1 Tax=Timema tahoe TaxID=61484 RepID=A0A7R9FEE2_9NEOP|nr:unnamed protein product [Timema tahoe]
MVGCKKRIVELEFNVRGRAIVVVSRDVASRGLDLPSVDWIVQYTAPCSTSDYVHRVGRTARVGSHGSALLFLAPGEAEFVRNLENRTVRLQQEINFCQQNAPPFRLEEAATALQLRFETAVMGQQALHNLACKDHVTDYSGPPSPSPDYLP